MKRAFPFFFQLFSARWVVPVVLALFAALYCAIAFFTDEALSALIGYVHNSILLQLLLSVLLIGLAARLVLETLRFVRRQRALRGKGEPAGLFGEEITMAAADELSKVEQWLASAGYRVTKGSGFLAAFRGVSSFPARFLFLMGTFSLFLGIFLSVTGRSSQREAVIEGEPLPLGIPGRVAAMALREQPDALILARSLSVTVQYPEGGRRVFSLYPPGMTAGRFIYPRYLGVAPLVRFSAPDLQQEVADYYLLMIYPPGREDKVTIPGTPYKIFIRLAEPPAEGSDPFVTGRMLFQCRLVKGEEQVFAGTVPLGGTLSQKGYALAFPEARRFAATDFIIDYGVWPVWLALLLFSTAALLYPALRLVNPRREILLHMVGAELYGYSLAEGRARRHAGLFHETLDLLAVEKRREDPKGPKEAGMQGASNGGSEA